MLDDAVKGQRELIEVLGVAPLASIPYLLIAEEKQGISRKQKFAWAAAAGGFMLVLVLVHFLYRPLDVLWFIALRKAGLGY